MLRWTKHPWQRNLNQIASGNPGAVQIGAGGGWFNLGTVLDVELHPDYEENG